ncbi:MAG: (4Fe-4S)-binding protein [Bacteroidetes bacterium]|nr:(4Fe-4S)-binding protein [Bacteroidota bacterium]
MRIAVAGGKGGTGKTLVAVTLASLLSSRCETALVDLDVEEPNDHLYFDMPLRCREEVYRIIPAINDAFCDQCGVCGDVCAYNALLVLSDRVLVFPELCRSCRGCMLLCPKGAVGEATQRIGSVEIRCDDGLTLYAGRLRIGERSVPELIRAVKTYVEHSQEICICDAPAGTACAAVEAVRDADYGILVAESTPFGLHDLDLMVRTMRQLRRPFGVVVNKAVARDRSIQEYCIGQDIEILGELPWREDIARVSARGEIVTDVLPDTVPLFERILGAVLKKEEVTA